MPAYTPYTPMYQPYGNYPIFQPYQTPQAVQQPVQQAQQTAQASSMIWVRNAQEAAMYPVAPNNAVALWDSGVSCIYLKQADASGKPTMKTYDLIERIETPAEPAPDTSSFATKAELAALAGVVKDVDGIIAAIREDVDALKEPKKKKKEETDG